MESRLDSIFRTGFQPAEKTDTRQGIRREEQTGDQPRKKHDRPDTQEETAEDDTVISVAGLYSFLKTLLIETGEPGLPDTPLSDSAGTSTESPAESGRAAAAASAYQQTARSTGSGQISLRDTPTARPAGPGLALSAEDLRIVHNMIENVETLAGRGISTITLRKADRFLASLADGVARALGGESHTTSR